MKVRKSTRGKKTPSQTALTCSLQFFSSHEFIFSRICEENAGKYNCCHCTVDFTSRRASSNLLFGHCNGIMCHGQKGLLWWHWTAQKHLLFECEGYCNDMNHDRGRSRRHQLVLWSSDEPRNSGWALARCCFHWKGMDYFQIYLNTVSAYTITNLRSALSLPISLTDMKRWTFESYTVQ